MFTGIPCHPTPLTQRHRLYCRQSATHAMLCTASEYRPAYALLLGRDTLRGLGRNSARLGQASGRGLQGRHQGKVDQSWYGSWTASSVGKPVRSFVVEWQHRLGHGRAINLTPALPILYAGSERVVTLILADFRADWYGSDAYSCPQCSSDDEPSCLWGWVGCDGRGRSCRRIGCHGI